jgi:hypothetical protein
MLAGDFRVFMILIIGVLIILMIFEHLWSVEMAVTIINPQHVRIWHIQFGELRIWIIPHNECCFPQTSDVWTFLSASAGPFFNKIGDHHPPAMLMVTKSCTSSKWWSIPVFIIGFQPSKVMQDFFYPQYNRGIPIFSHIQSPQKYGNKCCQDAKQMIVTTYFQKGFPFPSFPSIRGLRKILWQPPITCAERREWGNDPQELSIIIPATPIPIHSLRSTSKIIGDSWNAIAGNLSASSAVSAIKSAARLMPKSSWCGVQNL